MTSRRLRRILHLVLAAAAAEGAYACGGAVSSNDDGSSRAADDDSADRTAGGENENLPGRPRAPRDAGPDAFPDTGPIPPGGGECRIGQLDPDPALCCAEGDTTCAAQGGGGGGPDGGACALDCRKVCAQVGPSLSASFQSCSWSGSATDPKIQYYCGACGVGRIPEGAEGCARGASVGERLAMQAYYEAVSVVAFERLAETLDREGAPRSLARRARRAAKDEARHASTFARLASREGAWVPAVEMGEASTSLLELALENAREGCVRETYGALVALHQARHAEEPEIRRAFAEVAEDEIAHAALSWDLTRWFETKLSQGERAQVSAARAEAIAMLREASIADHDDVDARLGAPAPRRGAALYDALFAELARAAA